LLYFPTVFWYIVSRKIWQPWNSLSQKAGLKAPDFLSLQLSGTKKLNSPFWCTKDPHMHTYVDMYVDTELLFRILLRNSANTLYSFRNKYVQSKDFVHICFKYFVFILNTLWSFRILCMYSIRFFSH
jgi:hypothetical protein